MIFFKISCANNIFCDLFKSIANRRILNFERFHDFAARTIEVSCTIKVESDGAEEKLWTQKIRFAECSHRGVEFFWAEVVVENYFHLLASLRSLSESRQLRTTMFLLMTLEARVIVMRIFTILRERSNEESRSLIFSRRCRSTKDPLNAARYNGYRSRLNVT